MKLDLDRSVGRCRIPQHSQAIDTLQNLIHDYEKSHCRLAHTHTHTHLRMHTHTVHGIYEIKKKILPRHRRPRVLFLHIFLDRVRSGLMGKNDTTRIATGAFFPQTGHSHWAFGRVDGWKKNKRVCREVGKIKIKIEQSDKKKEEIPF